MELERTFVLVGEGSIARVRGCHYKDDCYCIYTAAQKCGEHNSVSTDVLRAFEVLWSCLISSKFAIFGWCVLQDRIATKDALKARGILADNVDSAMPQ